MPQQIAWVATDASKGLIASVRLTPGAALATRAEEYDLEGDPISIGELKAILLGVQDVVLREPQCELILVATDNMTARSWVWGAARAQRGRMPTARHAFPGPRSPTHLRDVRPLCGQLRRQPIAGR